MRKKYLAMGCALLLAAMNVQAGIMASATRVLFLEGDTEKSLMLSNTNGYPIVAQTWVDNGDVNAAPERSHAPFVTLPSVFVLRPSVMKGLRILFIGANLPTDRESVYWLNLYEIPPTQQDMPPMTSRITLSMNTQMKIFYRPKTLKGGVERAAKGVSFSLVEESPNEYLLRCNNRSAFYLSFANISIQIDGLDYAVRQENDMMIAPLSIRDYRVSNISISSPLQKFTVKATFIDEKGQQFMNEYLN
ncbi:molecular chaperone (plasmid) [Serratia sp. JSRIV002]|uniref:fimbrial biogenesis chaperone n=1 Tax=Serratia sp. JSRIV002 TaxID=2831894 RepID=UPI001CBD4328|nr:molecular chaperone [Serratia sp. JSRIV002]UAN54650.1 molecular chaperone [Serratia sp. JSRIV002]